MDRGKELTSDFVRCSYILGAEVFFAMRNIPVVCKEGEYATFPAPTNGQTCDGESSFPEFDLLSQTVS